MFPQTWANKLTVLALLSIAGSVSAAEEKVLNVYNWNDYVAKDTIANFEKETGIKVKYDVYDSNETLQAKLLTGKSGYDVVVPSLEFAGKQIQTGVHKKLDKKLLPNYANLDTGILSKMVSADPGNQYLIPYMWGTTALGINEDKVKKALGGKMPADLWQLVFDPAITSKLKSCGISYMDTPSDVYSMVNIYLGKDANDFSKATLDAATAQLIKVRKDVKVFNSSPIDLLANGDVCVGIAFSGDVYMAKNRAIDAKNGQKISYVIPKKGTIMWIDNLAIPKDAKHPENAHKFLNYIMKAETAAGISNAVFYANPNTKATPLVKKEIASDPNIYPSEALKKQLVAKKVIPAEEQRALTQNYTKFKTAK